MILFCTKGCDEIVHFCAFQSSRPGVWMGLTVNCGLIHPSQTTPNFYRMAWGMRPLKLIITWLEHCGFQLLRFPCIRGPCSPILVMLVPRVRGIVPKLHVWDCELVLLLAPHLTQWNMIYVQWTELDTIQTYVYFR